MTRPPNCPPELQPLLYDLLDPIQEELDTDRLEAVLKASPEARAYYAQLMQLHAELQLLSESPLTSPLSAIGSDQGKWHNETKSGSAESQQVSLWARVFRLPAAGTAVLLALLCISAGLAVLAVLDVPAPTVHPNASAPAVAQLVATHQCRWAGDQGQQRRDEFFAGDLLAIASGQAELRFNNGTKVVLVGPARMRIDSNASCSLELGDAIAEVPKPASGFTIHTETAMVVDLGTRFAVSVAEGGVTQVHVFQGKVAVQPGGGHDEGASTGVRHLVAGEAIQISQARKFQPTPFAPNRFVRRTLDVSHVLAHQGGGLLRSDGRQVLGGNTDGVRRIGSSSEVGVSLVTLFLFRLPDVDDIQQLDSANLAFTLKSIDGEPDFEVDLYGLGYISSAAIESDWFFEGAADPTTPTGYRTGRAVSPVTCIASGVVSPATQPGQIVIKNATLTKFVSSLFNQGAQPGDLAVFRLNAASPTKEITRATGYNVVHSTSLAGGTSPNEIATLSLFTGKQIAQANVASPRNPGGERRESEGQTP